MTDEMTTTSAADEKRDPVRFKGEVGQHIQYGARDGSLRTLEADARGYIDAETDEDEATLKQFGLKHAPAAAQPKPADKPKEV